MTQSALNILVNGLFDYSGMFPPESKTFPEAITTSAQFAKTLKRPFMVGADVVLSFSEIRNLTVESLVSAGFSKDSKLKIAVLGSQTMSAYADLIHDFNFLNNYFSRNSQINAEVVSYEMKINPQFLSTPNIGNKLISECDFHFAFEPDLSGNDWLAVLDSTIKFVSSHPTRMTLKFRGTGPTGICTDKISVIVKRAAAAKINLKATGGLHHPILEPNLYKNNLGFLNCAVAIYLSHFYQDKISLEDIQSCLDCENTADFNFYDKISYKNFSIPINDIKLLKSRFRFGVGSCSLSEPDSDLCRLFD